MNTNGKLHCALGAIEICKSVFAKANRQAVSLLKAILKPVGEHGVTVNPIGKQESAVVWAEEFGDDRHPVSLIRCLGDKLEVFISEYGVYEDPEFGPSIATLPEGKWVDWDDVYVDVWLLLDHIEAYIEYADGYDK